MRHTDIRVVSFFSYNLLVNSLIVGLQSSHGLVECHHGNPVSYLCFCLSVISVTLTGFFIYQHSGYS